MTTKKSIVSEKELNLMIITSREERRRDDDKNKGKEIERA